jgi:hypothetical protein
MARDDDFADRGNSPVDGWPPDFEHLVIPDDARELDADARALARERRAATRADRLRRVLRLPGGDRSGPPWPIAMVVVALVAALVGLLAVFRPPGPAAPRARPLASTGLRPPGTERGLTPDAQVRRDNGTPARVRDFRPAVLALVPAGYDAAKVAEMLRTVRQVADKRHVHAVAIGSDAPTVPTDLARSALVLASDTDHQLLPAYQVRDTPKLVLVRADGVVSRILPGAAPDSVLDPEVAALTG